MANPFTSLHVHVVFSTKNRERWLAPEVEEEFEDEYRWFLHVPEIEAEERSVFRVLARHGLRARRQGLRCREATQGFGWR